MSKIVHMPVPVMAEHKPRGRRGTQSDWARVDVPLQVSGISETEAPVAVVARSSARGHVTYRSSGNALWRPLLTGPITTREILTDLDGLSKMAIDADFNQSCDMNTCNDQPFGNALAATFHKHNVWMSELPRLADLHRLESDQSVAVAAEAVRIASEDLLEIGGILHKRTVAPCWGVGIRANLPYNGGYTGIVLPDLIGEKVMAFVPPDRIGDALELQAMAYDLSRKEAAERNWIYEPLPAKLRDNPGVIEILGELPVQDYPLMTMQVFRDRVVDTFDVIKFEDVPLNVAGFVIDLRRGVEARERGRAGAPDDISILSSVKAAWEAMDARLWHWHRLSPTMVEAGFHVERVERQARLDADAQEALDAVSLAVFS